MKMLFLLSSNIPRPFRKQNKIERAAACLPVGACK